MLHFFVVDGGLTSGNFHQAFAKITAQLAVLLLLLFIFDKLKFHLAIILQNYISDTLKANHMESYKNNW